MEAIDLSAALRSEDFASRLTFHARSATGYFGSSSTFRAPQRSEMAHAGGGFRQPERLSHLLVGELLEVAHEDDLAVVVGKFFEHFLKAAFQLVTERGGGGRQFPVDELPGQLHGRTVGPFLVQPLLLVDAAPLRLAMAAVRVDDAVLRQAAQPEVERHRRIAEIFGEAFARFEEDVLHDVAGIDARRNGAVEAEADHPPHRLAMPGEQLIDGAGVAALGLLNQFLRSRGFGPHGVILYRRVRFRRISPTGPPIACGLLHQPDASARGSPASLADASGWCNRTE